MEIIGVSANYPDHWAAKSTDYGTALTATLYFCT